MELAPPALEKGRGVRWTRTLTSFLFLFLPLILGQEGKKKGGGKEKEGREREEGKEWEVGIEGGRRQVTGKGMYK